MQTIKQIKSSTTARSEAAENELSYFENGAFRLNQFFSLNRQKRTNRKLGIMFTDIISAAQWIGITNN